MSLGHALKRSFFWLSWPVLFVYFQSSPRSRVLIYDGSKILLVRGAWKKLYDDEGYGLAGGGIKRKELPMQGAARETKEELGLNSKNLQALGSERLTEYGLKYQAYFFAMQLPVATRLTLQRSEIADAQWFTTEELATIKLKPEARRALELWAAALG